MITSSKTIARNRRHVRVRARIKGLASRPRLVVFRSNRVTFAQIIDDERGVTLAGSSTLAETKGTKVEQAFALGKKIAGMATEKNLSSVVFDRNGYRYHGRVKAVADGAREGGLIF